MFFFPRNLVYSRLLSRLPARQTRRFLTSDLSGEGAAGNVLVVKLHNDVVVSRSCGQVGHGAGAVFVVLAGDLGFRGTLDRK